MDISLLVKLLAPALPMLLGLGQKAIEKGAEKLGEKGAEGLVGKIWSMLQPKVEEKPAALEAAEDVAKAPENVRAIASLEHQLEKILEDPENAQLKAEVAKLLEKSEKVSGSKYVMHISGSNVAAGDGNTITMNFGNKSQD
jgi:hypothetical protein